MGGGHTHVRTYRHADSSAVHLLPPQVKIVCAVVGVVCVVATPREVYWAFGAYLVLLLGVWALARIGVGWFARRALIELPFVVLALALPFTGPADLGPFSREGLLAGWNIVAKGTLGVLISLTLAATTSPGDIVLGLRRLRAPTLFTTIATLMLRYVEVIGAEANRMRVARLARGHDPRVLWQAAAVARGIGSLFIRSYERGERVHLAMLSRGWTGAMPDHTRVAVPVGVWVAGVFPAVLAAGVLASGVMTR